MRMPRSIAPARPISGRSTRPCTSTVRFDAREWGRGLYTSLFAILAAQGFVNAYAGITLPNDSSVALHESLGLRPVGVYRKIGYKAGAWHDVGWWQLTVKDPPASPQPPVLLADIQGQPGWDAMLSAGMPLIRAQGARGHGSI